MSTPTETRNEIDEEPEEGEIQDDEGSLEDVSSDDELASLGKRRERTCTVVTVRGQFVKTEKKQIIHSPRREMRLCPSERSDVNFKKRQTRVKSGCRMPGVSDSYYEGVLRHKSLKDHSQKVSGKMHEKENKIKESKKSRRRSTPFYGSGSDMRNAYIGVEHAEPYFSSTSSKGPWHKGDVKDKHKKRKKSKGYKIGNPLGVVSASQTKTGRECSNVIECAQSEETTKDELTQTIPQGKKQPEKKSELSFPASPSSDIQILDVPVVVPEIITICDSDEEILKKGNENINVNISSAQEEDVNISSAQEEDKLCDIQLPPDPIQSPPKEVVEQSCGDPDDNLKLLREAALNSSKSETCVDVIRDDEVLQLRLAALRSAIIRKCEERKKKGITLTKTNRNVGDKQVMSISPLGSPNYSDEIDRDLCSPFEFNTSSNHCASEAANDSEVDKITTIDMELAESDEEKDQVYTESGYVNCEIMMDKVDNNYCTFEPDGRPLVAHRDGSGNIIYSVNGIDAEKEQVCAESGYAICGILEDRVGNNYSTFCVPDGRPQETHRDDLGNIIYSISETLVPMGLDCPPPTCYTTVCSTDSPAGYIIGDQEQDLEMEIPSILTQPLHCVFEPPSDLSENSRNVERLDSENQIPSVDQILEVSNCEHVPDKLLETVEECCLTEEVSSKSVQPLETVEECCLTEEVSSKSVQPLETSETVEFVNSESRNNEPVDVISSRSDCSFLSPVSRELDLETMIVLDEVGKSSDEARSECSIEDMSTSGKLVTTLYEERENVSENCDSVNVPELFEENSGMNLSNLICNSRSSGENVPIYVGNFEATQDTSEMFEKNSDVNLYGVTNSRSPINEIVHCNSENFDVCRDTLNTCGKVSEFSLQILSSSSQVSNDLPSDENINKDLQPEVCDKDGNEVMCESSNLSSNSLNATETRENGIHSQSVSTTVNVENSENHNLSKFSSGENEEFPALVNAEAVDCSKSIPKPVLSPACDEKSADSSIDKNLLEEPCYPQSDFSSTVDQLQPTDHTFLTDNINSGENIGTVDQLQPMDHTFLTDNLNIGENIGNNQEIVTEDDEIVLRDSLIAMMKKRTKEQNNKLLSETDDPMDLQNGDVVPVDNGISRNIPPLPIVSILHNEKCESDGFHKNDNKNHEPSLKQMPVSCSLKTSSVVNSLPKRVYPLRNLTSINKQGIKGNKMRRHEVKVPGIFNVNVPKLVINLGEDSDSNEDENESVTVPSNLNASDASEESKDNTSGSQSVSVDFEKKLDLLLKQARFQQETITKDDLDNLSETPNSPSSSVNKVTILPSANINVDVEITSKSVRVSSGSSNTGLLSSSKVSPLVAHGANNQREKKSSINTLGKDKMLFRGNNVNVTRTSIGRAVDPNKRDIHGRIKCTSAIVNPSSSVSSVVDIGLLPSSKQKEYIRLKRQLAQLSRKDHEVKAKENVTLVNTAKFPVKKDGMKETKLITNEDVKNSIIKSSLGIVTERSPFTRKFVRKGQGGTIMTRTDLGKSRRIVKSIASSHASQTPSRNRFTVTTSNKVGVSSVEGSSAVRRVLCVPQKRIVGSVTSAKKVSPGFQITASSANSSTSDVQSQFATIVQKFSELVNATDAQCQGDVVRTTNNTEEKQTSESSVQAGSKVMKKCNSKTVLKRKASVSDISGVLRKKVSNEQKSSREENENESSLTNSQLKDICGSEINECTIRLSNIKQIGENTPLSKRKRSNSEQSGMTVRKKFVGHESTEQQTIPTAKCNCKNRSEMVIPERTLAEGLWDSESKLISKRYQVLEDIASVQLNLHEIEKVSEFRQQIIRDIKKLQKEMSLAEAQLCKKEELLKVLYSEVEIAKRDIMRRQSETLLLSVECEEMGGKVHGSKYSVPNTCTDLIRKGMAAISKSLQEMEDKKHVSESECESHALCQSDEAGLKENSTVQEKANEIAETVENVNNEDSCNQNSGSYLSPLDAMRAATEPNNDNQAVLCPYHIMGSCKDKECSYLH